MSWHQQAHTAAVQRQSRLVLHQLLCHWPLGLETRDAGADDTTAWGCFGAQGHKQLFAGFAEVAGQGAQGVPSASCWARASALALASLSTEINHQHQREQLKKERRGFVYFNQK